MEIDGRTKVCGLIGSPVAHSLSPLLHNAAYRELGLNYRYLPFHVESGVLERALRGITALELDGVNVTAPHKEAVLQYLDELDPTAAATGAVNTICNRGGRLHGFNTDGEGFLWSLREMGRLPGALDGAAVILGAGGAVRSVAYALAGAGAASIVILNRTAARAEEAASMLREHFPRVGVEAEKLSMQSLSRCRDRITLLVNALPEEPWNWEGGYSLPAAVLAYDLRYSPPLSPFLAWAAAAGAGIANGLGMLVGQAALSFSLFTGAAPPFQLMLDRVKHPVDQV